jgi:hypothetical protein
MASLWEQAKEDGKQARARGEPRDPTPYLPRYTEWTGHTITVAWFFGFDEEDVRLAVEEARPTVVGEVEWRPLRLANGERRCTDP